MLPDVIRSNRTLSNDTVYTFYSTLVTNNAVLTIEPGTVIKSMSLDAGKGRSESFAIDRGSKIMAEGTSEKPIVFTSGSAVGRRQHGDWGGIFILGKAPVSAYNPDFGIPLNEMSVRGFSSLVGGGDDPADNSGVFKYVRIEFAGLSSANSYGLTCIGVGNGTIIENVQSSYTQTCAFGFYGGTVNARNLVAFNTAITGFVYGNGYVGKQQFLVSYKHPYFATYGGYIYTDDGVLVFNDIDNNPLVQNTRPVLSNFTIIGPYNNSGYDAFKPWNAALNVSYGGTFVLKNSVLMGMPKGGIKFSDDAAALHILDGQTIFSNNLVHSNTPEEAFTIDPGNVYSVDNTTLNTYATANNNTSYTTPSSIALTDPFNFSTPGLLPKTGSPTLSGTDFTGSDFSEFFTPVTYRGAFGTVNWMEGWTNFYPVTTAY